MFTPFINLSQDYGARPMGDPVPVPSNNISHTPFGSTPGNMDAPIPTAMNGISMANPMMYGMGLTHPTAPYLHNPVNNPFTSYAG